jgi:F0F1-type ATP synthase beta subunit
VFTGTPGKYVPLENTIKDFKGVLEVREWKLSVCVPPGFYFLSGCRVDGKPQGLAAVC